MMESSYCKIHKLSHTSSHTEVQCSKQHNGQPEIHLCKLLLFFRSWVLLTYTDAVCLVCFFYRLSVRMFTGQMKSLSPKVNWQSAEKIRSSLTCTFISDIFMAVYYMLLIYSFHSMGVPGGIRVCIACPLLLFDKFKQS